MSRPVRPLLLATLLPLLFATLLFALRGPARAEPVPLARPGTPEAADASQRHALRGPGGSAFVRSPSGLLLPDQRIFVVDEQALRDRARWGATRRLVFRYLKAEGVRSAPAPYQQIVARIHKRAARALEQQGKTLDGWKMVAVQGGMANEPNAAAWTGGLITINRPMVDLSFQIASVMVNAETPEQRDTELWRLSRWRQAGALGDPPAALQIKPEQQARRDALAESILSRVVLHEMGHAASGHLALRERQLVLPGQPQRRDLARSVAQEHEADLFAVQLGRAGGTRLPGVMPMLDYYRFIANPTFSARGPRDLADWRTHPISADRYNNQLQALGPRAAGLPPPLAPQIVVPNQP